MAWGGMNVTPAKRSSRSRPFPIQRAARSDSTGSDSIGPGRAAPSSTLEGFGDRSRYRIALESHRSRTVTRCGFVERSGSATTNRLVSPGRPKREAVRLPSVTGSLDHYCSRVLRPRLIATLRAFQTCYRLVREANRRITPCAAYTWCVCQRNRLLPPRASRIWQPGSSNGHPFVGWRSPISGVTPSFARRPCSRGRSRNTAGQLAVAVRSIPAEVLRGEDRPDLPRTVASAREGI